MHPFAYILAAALLNVLSKAPAVIALLRLGRSYDNSSPRQQFEAEPKLKRLYAAHLNTLEAFPVFAVGMLSALWAGVDQAFVDTCGGLFLLARIIYLLAYSRAWSTLRSLIWGIGWLASLGPIFYALTHLDF